MEGIGTELGEVALVYSRIYDLVKLGAKAGLVPRVLVMGIRMEGLLLPVIGDRIHEFMSPRGCLFLIGIINCCFTCGRFCNMRL